MSESLYAVSWRQGHDLRTALVQAKDVELGGKQRIRVESKIDEAEGPRPKDVIDRLFKELDARLGTLSSVDDEAAVDHMFREIDVAVPSGMPSDPKPIGPFFLNVKLSEGAAISRAIQTSIGRPDVVVCPL
jgi:hypothetical protein